MSSFSDLQRRRDMIKALLNCPMNVWNVLWTEYVFLQTSYVVQMKLADETSPKLEWIKKVQ